MRRDSNWRTERSMERWLIASVSARKASRLPTSRVSRGRHSALIFWIAVSLSPPLARRVISRAMGP